MQDINRIHADRVTFKHSLFYVQYCPIISYAGFSSTVISCCVGCDLPYASFSFISITSGCPVFTVEQYGSFKSIFAVWNMQLYCIIRPQNYPKQHSPFFLQDLATKIPAVPMSAIMIASVSTPTADPTPAATPAIINTYNLHGVEVRLLSEFGSIKPT